MINVTAKLRPIETPYLHYSGDGLLSAADLARLNSAVPDRDVFDRLIKEGSEHRKQYHMWRCEPGSNSKRTPVADRLTEPWSRLVDSALSDEFRGWVSEQVKLDLSRCPVTVGLYIFGDGDYTTNDTGKLEKSLTFALYLNEHWEESYGGKFQTFTSKESTEPVTELVPIGGRCVCMTPGESTFHRIQAVDSGGKTERLLMMVEFWRP